MVTPLSLHLKMFLNTYKTYLIDPRGLKSVPMLLIRPNGLRVFNISLGQTVVGWKRENPL